MVNFCSNISTMDFATYRKKWAEAGNKTPEIPLNLDIELSCVCNLKCPFCFLQNKSYKKPSPAFMRTGQALALIFEAHELGIPAIKFNWRGEATLHPDFPQIANYAGQMGFHEILLNTNGNYHPDLNKSLLHCTKVMFSLDSCDNKTYKIMRKGGNLSNVMVNIDCLSYSGHKNIWVRRVITKDNESEDFKGEVKKLFGDKVKVAEHYCFDRANEATGEGGRLYCGYPSQRLVVATDGTAYPCCVDYGQTMKVGDVELRGIKAIWEGQKMSFCRSSLKKGKFPSTACRNCTSWMAYNNEKREKVADISI